jgi:hypothetical protein
MADKKISELTELTSVEFDQDVIPIEHTGEGHSSSKIKISHLPYMTGVIDGGPNRGGYTPEYFISGSGITRFTRSGINAYDFRHDTGLNNVLGTVVTIVPQTGFYTGAAGGVPLTVSGRVTDIKRVGIATNRPRAALDVGGNMVTGNNPPARVSIAPGGDGALYVTGANILLEAGVNTNEFILDRTGENIFKVASGVAGDPYSGAIFTNYSGGNNSFLQAYGNLNMDSRAQHVGIGSLQHYAVDYPTGNGMNISRGLTGVGFHQYFTIATNEHGLLVRDEYIYKSTSLHTNSRTSGFLKTGLNTFKSSILRNDHEGSYAGDVARGTRFAKTLKSVIFYVKYNGTPMVTGTGFNDVGDLQIVTENFGSVLGTGANVSKSAVAATLPAKTLADIRGDCLIVRDAPAVGYMQNFTNNGKAGYHFKTTNPHQLSGSLKGNDIFVEAVFKVHVLENPYFTTSSAIAATVSGQKNFNHTTFPKS